MSFGGGDSWWEQMELTRLNLSSNEIRELSGDIVNFKSLQILDVSHTVENLYIHYVEVYLSLYFLVTIQSNNTAT